MTFGDRIITARKKRGFSQEKLGEVIGVDKRIISRYETGKTMPSIEVARKIAVALQVSLDHLTDLDYSLFIDDPEMTRLLKDYDNLPADHKTTIKKVLKAFRVYDQIEAAQSQLSA